MEERPWREGWWASGVKEIWQNPIVLLSAGIIVFVTFVAIFSHWLAPYAFDEQNIDIILQGPSWKHPMGTDKLGRDLFSRVISGARMSMAVGIITAIISLIIGSFFGALSGWFGGWFDGLMMRIVDIAYAVPSLVVMILVKVLFDSIDMFSNPELRALTGTVLALSIMGWVTLARLVRGQVLQVKTELYIEAGKSLGLGHFDLLWRHVFPNILGPIIIMLTFRIPANILAESFLSFIGLGLQPPYSSWGVLASDGADMLESYPHLILFPGLVLFITMLAFQLFGDGLRDAFDPKTKVYRDVS